jgi:hypothetical protein
VPDAQLKTAHQSAANFGVQSVTTAPLSVKAGGIIFYNKTAVAFELSANATGYDAGTGTLTLSDFFRKVYLKGTVTGLYCDGYKVILSGTLASGGTFTCEVAALGGPGKDTFSVTTSGGYNVSGKLTTGSVKTTGDCANPYPTAEPTVVPTYYPTATPTYYPTATPTYYPTATPTYYPTMEPTTEPTKEPTPEPTKEPTPEPTVPPCTDCQVTAGGQVAGTNIAFSISNQNVSFNNTTIPGSEVVAPITGVTCKDNTAVVTAQDENGDIIVFSVVDNGEGNNADDDTITITRNNTVIVSGNLTSGGGGGNIQVRERCDD